MNYFKQTRTSFKGYKLPKEKPSFNYFDQLKADAKVKRMIKEWEALEKKEKGIK